MNESYKKYITIVYTVVTTLLVMCVFVWACDDFYIGKSQEDIEKELMQSIFEVDSLIGQIKITLGDSSIIERK
tara:strand:- start:2985 stop:3203 length:219 start_codon:yes stop_codon:yes gene_type:complete